jgi:hypothetical protein
MQLSYRYSAVAVLVSNATMYKGDKGSVIVGGRVVWAVYTSWL